MATKRWHLEYLDSNGQWSYPGDPEACVFASESEADTARDELESGAAGAEYQNLADWRVWLEDPSAPRGGRPATSYADQELARKHYGESVS